MTVRIREYSKRGKKGWEVDITVRMPDGEVIRERVKAPVTSKSAAKFWGEQREAELLRNGKKKVATQEEAKEQGTEIPTLSQFAPRYINEYVRANRQKPSTTVHKQRTLQFYLEPRFGSRPLDQITNSDVQKLKAELAHLDPKTVNNVLSLLNTVLRTAVSWGVLSKLPAEIKLLKVHTKEVEFYDFPDYARLVQAARALDPRIHLLVLLGGDAGLRCGEILALEWRDIDLQRKLLNVQRSDWRGHITAPKGGRSRRIPLTEQLAAALAAHRRVPGQARVLTDDAGQPLVRAVLRGWMKRAQRLAGLKDTGLLHILRHTFCSRLAMRGAPAKAIQELAGHVSLTTTQRYMHLSPAAKDAAIRLLDAAPEAPISGDILETQKRSTEVPVPGND